MDLQLKQWRNQLQDDDESEHQQSVDRIPKLFFDQSQTQHQTDSSAVLPLFSSEPTSKVDCLSGFSQDSPSKFTRMGSYFSSAQWQELELQALIFRYMLAGAVVPPELLQPIKKSLHHSSSYLLQHYSPYQPAWYWGKAAMDPEPGRCRRTDGKKWRCSRDVVAGRKYCERHMNRGRNRSRKPVEIPTLNNSNASSNTNTNTNTNSCLGETNFTVAGGFRQQPDDVHGNGSSFLFSSSSHSSDLLRLSQCSEVGNNKSDGHILRHFFDDWPKPSQDPETSGNTSGRTSSSAMSLSISMPGNPPSASDVSLKLSTSNNNHNQEEETKQQQQQQLNMNWMGTHQMGGPLAEALRSSTSSSPTSVLHRQLTRGGV